MESVEPDVNSPGSGTDGKLGTFSSCGAFEGAFLLHGIDQVEVARNTPAADAGTEDESAGFRQLDGDTATTGGSL